MTAVTLVEQHHIREKDPRFEGIDAAAFAAKNLYNKALYEVRQAFIHRGEYILKCPQMSRQNMGQS
jgi:hypothetical protein